MHVLVRVTEHSGAVQERVGTLDATVDLVRPTGLLGWSVHVGSWWWAGADLGERLDRRD